MKNQIPRILLLSLILTTMTSCETIGDIFQAGMGVGIFVVVIVILLIWWIASKVRK